MTEPTPQPSPSEDGVFKAWAKRFFKENEWIINQLMRGIILLGIGWLGVKLAQIQSQNQSIEHKADTAAVAATDAKKEAVEAKGTALKTEVAAQKVLVTQTDDPKDKQALQESKAALAEHQAATREAAQQSK